MKVQMNHAGRYHGCTNPALLMLAILSSLSPLACRSRNHDPSPAKHVEGEFTIDAPAFLWTDVTTYEPQRFISSNSGGEGFVQSSDADLTKRLQAILNSIDESARQQNPEKFRKIPKPMAVVITKNEVNAFVTARGICVRQKARKSIPPDTTPTPVPTPSGIPQIDTSNWVLDLETPGYIYGTTLPDETSPPANVTGGYTPDRCPVVDAADIGWNPQTYVDLFNGALPEDKAVCKLTIEGDTIVAPGDDLCGYISDIPYPMIRFRAAANTVFFFSGLLRQMSETSVTTVAAHELAHYYRGHAVSVLDFRPYHFLQTRENELIKPAKTEDHADLRRAMEEASYLAAPRRTDGAELDANLYGFMTDFYQKLADLCPVGSSCVDAFKSMKTHAELPLAFELWGEIESKALQGEHRDYYLKFEKLFLELTALIKPSELNDSWIERLTADTAKPLQKFFPPVREQADLASWVRSADRAIVSAIPQLAEPFARAAELGLGFYSTEEEADEIGFDLAARQGVDKPKVGALWTEFMEAQKRDGYEAGLRETNWDTCIQWFNNNWLTADGKPASKNLQIDSLANIHHGLCYRLFNSQREWATHEFDRLLPKKPQLAFDDVAWKRLTTAIANPAVPQPAPSVQPQTLRSSSAAAADQRLRFSRKAACILAPDTRRRGP